MVTVFSLVLAGCGMGLDEAIPILEADIVEMTEDFFTNQEYLLSHSAAMNDYQGCYWPEVKVEVEIGGQLGRENGEVLLGEMRDYASARFGKTDEIYVDSWGGYFRADHQAGMIQVSITWDSVVRITGETGDCVDVGEVTFTSEVRHTPLANSRP